MAELGFVTHIKVGYNNILEGYDLKTHKMLCENLYID